MPESTRPLSALLVLAQSTGGIGRHVKTLAGGLAERGVSVTICAPQQSIEAIGLADLDAAIVPAPLGASRPGGLLAARSALKAAVARADIVHAHGLRAGADCVSFGRGVPLVVTLHNAPLRGKAWQLAHSLLTRYVARSSSLVLAASDDLADAARNAGARAVETTFVTAPTLGTVIRTPDQLRADLGIGDRPIVLAVGRLQRQKRLEVLVSAAAAWSADTDPVVLIAGDGPDAPSLRTQIAATGAPVHLLGDRRDIPDLLGAATALALPSEWEARALVVQEAMLAGVPVVCTAVGGLPGLVGNAASIVPVGDPAALRAALESIVHDPAERARQVKAVTAQAATWPTEGDALDDLVATYLDLTGRLRLNP